MLALVGAHLLLTGVEANAQTPTSQPKPQPQEKAGEAYPRIETGLVFTVLRLPQPIGEGAGGIGGRFGYNFSHDAGIEAEVNHFPGRSQFGETQGFFGLKLGFAENGGGFFVKARPGFIHFPSGGDLQARGLTQLNHFALDLGVVAERYFSNHTYIRLDLGDTIISYGGARILNPLNGRITPLGTIHNFQLSFGVGVYF